MYNVGIVSLLHLLRCILALIGASFITLHLLIITFLLPSNVQDAIFCLFLILALHTVGLNTDAAARVPCLGF